VRLVRTREEIAAELEALGWRLTSGPKRTVGGWRAMIQRGPVSVLVICSLAIGVLDELLRFARDRGRRRS